MVAASGRKKCLKKDEGTAYIHVACIGMARSAHALYDILRLLSQIHKQQKLTSMRNKSQKQKGTDIVIGTTTLLQNTRDS